MMEIPTLVKNKNSSTLFVDGNPYLILAGEVHNSSSSSLEYLATNVWPQIATLNLNTLLIAVGWEQIEKEQGQYDFSLIDGLLAQARQAQKRLILLWFGLWKNGQSFYIPQWMKRNPEKYWPVINQNGQKMQTISPLCEPAVKADAKAFNQLLAHLEVVDEQRTVIMVQVENELGLLGSDRDYGKLAQEKFAQTIPADLAELTGKTGTFKDVFGEKAAECFMEYYFARAAQVIAHAGKKAYPLPMYVNAWLEQYPWIPGTYPSGGPVASYLAWWQKLAPSIDVIAPDVYVSDFKTVSQQYQNVVNPLFIPEHRRDLRNLSHVFYAIGQGGLGFSPFGIEDFGVNPEEQTGLMNPQVLKSLNINVAAWDYVGSPQALSAYYDVLENIAEKIFVARKAGQVQAFMRKDEHEKGVVLSLQKGKLLIEFKDQEAASAKCAGFIIEDSDKVYILGTNFSFKVLGREILEYSEGRFEGLKYYPTRILNGDERLLMLELVQPTIQRLVLN